MITFTDLGLSSYLGNELFQYAALLGVAERRGYEVRLPPSSQHHLGTLIDLVTPTYTTEELRALRYRFGQVYPAHGYEPGLEDIPDWCDVYGYFESPRHFPARLRDHFRIRRSVQLEVDRIWAELELELTGPVVGVHVRRGDAVGSSHWLNLDKDVYYRQARDLFVEQGMRYVVVSDDLMWCRAHYADTNTIIAPPASAPVHLALMARCDHLITANSTFSWWAGWFHQPRGGTIVAPRRWYHDGTFDNAALEFDSGWTLL